jgi:arabinofuranan 3-O-arabinosyltransferase
VKPGRTKMQVAVSGATAPFWLVLGESQNAGWKATIKGGASLGGSQLVDGFANGWRIDPKGKQSLVVTLEWVPQRKVFAAIGVSVLGGLLCCALALGGFLKARRQVFALAGDAGAVQEEERDAAPVFAFPWVPAGDPVFGLRTQLLATLAAGVVAASVAGLGFGILVLAAVLVAFRIPCARAFLALAPPVLVGLIGLYMANKQMRDALPPVFEWPILFPRAPSPAWAAVVLFGADALYELVRRGRRRAGE